MTRGLRDKLQEIEWDLGDGLRLTEWEEGFLPSLRELIRDGDELSPPQEKAFVRLWARLRSTRNPLQE